MRPASESYLQQTSEVIAHFDHIASLYEKEVPLHVRQHLMNKFWKLASPWVPPQSKFLDIGCGHGMHVAFLHSKGIQANGIDASQGMIRSAKRRHPGLANCLAWGDATRLTFRSNSFDTASLIGVLHHLPDYDMQMTALEEALRIVKPGGHVLVRECNLLNPLFKLYWNYLFPLTSRIDRFGGENWISADKIFSALPHHVVDVIFFTFISNISPKFFFPLLKKIESILEKSALRSYAAHYLVVLRKQ